MRGARRAPLLLVALVAGGVLLGSAGTAEARWGRTRSSNRFWRDHPFIALALVVGALCLGGGNGRRNRTSIWRGTSHRRRW